MTQRFTHIMRAAVLAAMILPADYTLLVYFNRLVWPHFWPTWAFVVLAIGLTIVVWFPEVGYSIWMLRITGLLLVFIGQSYLLHSFNVVSEDRSLLAILHLVGFAGMFVIQVINYMNQIRPKDNRDPPPLPQALPYVAAVVPTYGEPYEILEKTVASLTRLDYPSHLLAVLISDDGHRPEVQDMARKHGVHYNLGAQKDAKAGNLNSALAYLERALPQVTLLLTQDADEVIHPSFLKKTVGYFNDPSMAFVQTPKDVIAPKGDPFGTRDRIFYDVLQPGRNGSGAAFACGSGVLWRIDALKTIGGFVTWNVVEDLTTSYWLHGVGYRSEYHNEKLSVGLAPDDVPGLLKQRGTWAVDTWRLFLFDNPLVKPGLSTAQRLQYLELGLFYLVSSFFVPLMMLVPLLSLMTGTFISISNWAFFPWVAISLLYYLVMSQGQTLFMLRMWQYWVGHGPTYFKAFWVAARSRHNKPKYVVTRKTRDNGFYAYLLWPQFLYLFAGAVAIIYGLFGLSEIDLMTRLSNIAVLLFFMFMVGAICRAALYGFEFRFLERMSRLFFVGHERQE